MKALEILKKIYANKPDTRFQRNNIDINFTIHDFYKIKEAIKEIEALIEKDKSKKCEECYKVTNRVLTLVEQRESDAKNTTIKLIKELEALENRSCEECKYHTNSDFKNTIDSVHKIK